MSRWRPHPYTQLTLTESRQLPNIHVYNNNNNNNSFICIAARMLDYTHNICHTGQYVYAVQHGNVSSHTWNTAIQVALGLLNAAKVPGYYTV